MKFCIIGSRGHVNYVFESMKLVPQLELCAISSGCEDDPSGLLERSRKAGAEPKVYADWREMLETEKPGLVAVDGPFDRHAEMTIFALERNIHVFCEKPIALSMDDLAGIEKALKNSSAHLLSMVGLRYQADFQYALEQVRRGAIGKVKMVRAQKSYKLGTRPDFYRKRATFGGTIPWVGSHALDWILAFSGSTFGQVFAVQDATDNHGYGDLEMTATLCGTMKNGVLFTANIDYLRPKTAPTHGDDQVRIAGTDGVIEVRRGKVELINAEGARELEIPPARYQLFSDFAQSVIDGKPCQVSDAETIELTRGCLLARESADTGKLVFC